ncbi:MAG: PSD1 domain-containing protein [Opitutaceae bacterium]|nr:PSD1 domain-containing protein [Opitutaceae bacterium]
MAAGLLAAGALAAAEPARFVRAINLNGPALTLDGRAWEAGAAAADFKATGKKFANQRVVLKPPTDAARTEMIRSSVWGAKVDLEVSGLAPGPHQVVLYVWEDNHSEQFDLLVNGKVVAEKFHSGAAGSWRRLGPWRAEPVEGKITVAARGASHGACNLSGLEIWTGEGPVPAPAAGEFVREPTPDQIAFFEAKIRPVLVESCYECHSAGAKKIKGGLVLDTAAGVREGGFTGPAIAPGEVDASLLVQALRHTSEDLAMPPKKKLPPHVIADFETWVRMGAPDLRTGEVAAGAKQKSEIDWAQAREWWSLRPIARPAPPAVRDARWPAGDLDRFILAKIEAAALAPAPDADKRALLRRATFDLTGLPPTPEETAAFLADDSPQAFARVVDRLLASPRYGERWGRHWLDVVRYADTAGDNSDYPIPQMHRYRDWVIAAFNRDLPYDEFVRDQLAGDLRGGATLAEKHDRLIATGYLANARRFGSRVDDYPQHLTIEDTIDNLGRSFLGLTISCARCHDHKFDPIPTQDYYSLYGIFHSTRYPWPGIELDKRQRDFVPLVPPGEIATAAAAIKARGDEIVRLNKQVADLRAKLKEIAGEAAAETKEGGKPEAKKQDKATLQARLKEAEKAERELGNTPLPFETAYAVAEGAQPGDVPVQLRGDPAKPGEVAPRRFLAALGGAALPSGVKTSGRAQLADWILAPENPLAARVMANRIWQHHFGRGLVPTPNDFGKQGKPPTHPELLDWLATRFREGGWSVKAMHRLILLSRTYRQAAVRSADAIARDPGNELLAGFPRRRLEAEAIRDALLALGGNLDLSPAGAHPFPPAHEWKFTQHNPFKSVYASDRRSVYLMTQRIQRHPYLAIFDGADPSASTPARPTSTTPLQALFLLNDPLVHDQAGRVAARLAGETPTERSRIERAYELLFARPPSAEERAAAERFLADARAKLAAPDENEIWRAYIRVLFRLNEFVYLD